MRSLRFLLSWEWFGYLVGVIVFAIACVFLSQWQFDRRAEVVANIERVQSNYDATAVPLDDLLAQDDAFDEDLEYRPVELEGTYLAEDQVLVRNRPQSGQPGFEVLVPFLTDDNQIFLVDRGWVATAQDGEEPDDIGAPPTGHTEVVARLKPAQEEVSRDAPSGQIANFYLEPFSQDYTQPVYTQAYGLMVTEDPAGGEPAPAQLSKPSTDEGSHLSYAFQWLAFGVLAFVGFGFAIKQTRRRIAEATEEELERGIIPERKPKPKRRDLDAEVEDALLDARDGARR